MLFLGKSHNTAEEAAMYYYDYFQIVFLIIFLSIFVGRTVYQTAKGARVFALGIGKTGFKSALEISFFFILTLWILEIVIHALKLDIQFLPGLLIAPIANEAALKITGIVFNSLGLCIFILALWSFGRSWRIGIDNREPGQLVTGGIFSFTRNPVFVFIDLYFLGTFLIYSNFFFLVLCIGTVLGIHYQIQQEEDFLLGHYGNRYRSYMKRVRRYI